MENKESLSTLVTNLTDIEKSLKAAITTGLEIVKNDSSLENDVLTMFITPSKRIYDYFLKETVRTGTETVGKKAIKYAMFKRF